MDKLVAVVTGLIAAVFTVVVVIVPARSELPFQLVIMFWTSKAVMIGFAWWLWYEVSRYGIRPNAKRK